MRRRFPNDDLAKALAALQPALEMAGVRLGAFLGGGAQGDVYEAGPGRVAKVMYGGYRAAEEWKVAGVLTAREDAGDPLPHGLVRTYRMLAFPEPQLGPYSRDVEIRILIRERLQEDDGRARAALATLLGALNLLAEGARFGHNFTEARDLYAWSVGNAAPKIVGLGMGWLHRRGLLTDDKAERRRMERDGAQILEAALWLYARGYVLDDYFDLHDMKPENIGFRGNRGAVALDLGVTGMR